MYKSFMSHEEWLIRRPDDRHGPYPGETGLRDGIAGESGAFVSVLATDDVEAVPSIADSYQSTKTLSLIDTRDEKW